MCALLRRRDGRGRWQSFVWAKHAEALCFEDSCKDIEIWELDLSNGPQASTP